MEVIINHFKDPYEATRIQWKLMKLMMEIDEVDDSAQFALQLVHDKTS